jgi:hypothetical protein
VSISTRPEPTGEFPVLHNTYTQAEAFERICPFRDEMRCAASGCMAWSWEPGQRDARIARGYCGITNRTPH